MTKHHAMKMYYGVEVQLHAILTSVLDGDNNVIRAFKTPNSKQYLNIIISVLVHTQRLLRFESFAARSAEQLSAFNKEPSL
jgi:hypothetical protein